MDIGPTRFIPASHKLATVGVKYDSNTSLSGIAPCLSMGSAICFDYRTVHRGTANTSEKDRPLLYFTFARKWFSDTENFPTISIFDK